MTVSRTKSERHKRFLEAGFFPAELPPPFVSNDLARHRAVLEKAFESLPKHKGEKWYYRYVTTPEVILFPRPLRVGRQFTILNPISYFFLSRELSTHWIEIKKHVRKSTSSVSRLIFDWDGARTFLRPNFEARDTETRRLSLGNSYLLHSDISRYYHSIYTHSIPWALHTKAVAKANRTMALLGNRLDTFVRNGQDGQTVGLPVGPDTSRVLAEMLGVAIDVAVSQVDKRMKRSAIRFVDDITAGAENAEDAERIRNMFRKVLHGFQLDINEEKTETVRVVALEYRSWRHELFAKMPRRNGALPRFQVYFDLIATLSNTWPKANVPVYALKQSRVVFIGAYQWKAVEDFLLVIYRAHPVTLPVIVEILANRNLEKADVDVDKVGIFIKANLKRLAENDRLGEFAWMLFLAKVLKVNIRASDLQGISNESSSVCALLACDLEQRGLISGALNKTEWNKSLTGAGLKSEMWLYAYEASRKGWTGKPTHFIKMDPCFSELLSRDITFYDERKNFVRVRRKLAIERENRKKEQIAFSRNLEEADLDILQNFEDIYLGEYIHTSDSDFYDFG